MAPGRPGGGGPAPGRASLSDHVSLSRTPGPARRDGRARAPAAVQVSHAQTPAVCGLIATQLSLGGPLAAGGGGSPSLTLLAVTASGSPLKQGLPRMSRTDPSWM